MFRGGSLKLALRRVCRPPSRTPYRQTLRNARHAGDGKLRRSINRKRRNIAPETAPAPQYPLPCEPPSPPQSCIRWVAPHSAISPACNHRLTTIHPPAPAPHHNQCPDSPKLAHCGQHPINLISLCGISSNCLGRSPLVSLSSHKPIRSRLFRRAETKSGSTTASTPAARPDSARKIVNHAMRLASGRFGTVNSPGSCETHGAHAEP